MAQIGPQRDGLVQNIPGYGGLIYQAIRWEPLCGTLGGLPLDLNLGSSCIQALYGYSNITDNSIAYFDTSGIRYEKAGIGLGKALCMCFAMSDLGGKATDICWYFDEIGQYVRWVNSEPQGSYRPGAAKSLKRCADVDLPALQAHWSQTAIMPTFTGQVQTFQNGLTTIRETVVQTQTYVLTPTVVPFTIQSSRVVTGSNGQVSTLDASYVTNAPVLNNAPSSSSNGDDENDPLALGLSLGLAVPIVAALAAFMWWYWLRHKRAMQIIANNNNNNGANANSNTGNTINPSTGAAPPSSSQSPPYNIHGPAVSEKLPRYMTGQGTYA
ncbi:hypothetical protein FRC17_008905 [Serendipita sp. 399]|nr:hypothetical protein FRC17_008905 [Serendipita sp. 399]